MDLWKKCVVPHIININIIKYISPFKNIKGIQGAWSLHSGYWTRLIYDNCNHNKENAKTETLKSLLHLLSLWSGLGESSCLNSAGLSIFFQEQSKGALLASVI